MNYIITCIYVAGKNPVIMLVLVSNGEMTNVLSQSEREDKDVTVKGKCSETLAKEIGYSFDGVS